MRYKVTVDLELDAENSDDARVRMVQYLLNNKPRVDVWGTVQFRPADDVIEWIPRDMDDQDEFDWDAEPDVVSIDTRGKL